MRNYREWEIFSESKRLAIEVHTLSLAFPKFELYEEGSQVRRSSKAVTSMMVEGYGRRRYKADFVKYLVYSHAECDETRLHLEFLRETNSCKEKEKANQLRDEYEQLSKRINKFIQWVEKHFEYK